MQPRRLVLLLAGLLTTIHAGSALDDLIAQETGKQYSSRIRGSSGVEYGQKTTPRQKVLDFRIEPTDSLRGAAAGGGNKGKEDDDEEKTLAQQVADGKYGLIQNELFANGAKRPGILSYLPNPEVPNDTKSDFGGLDKEEIWLAEDHVLVLRGGSYHNKSTTPWKAIDDYVAPPRQVEIPKNPKIPPPFPVRLTENGPLELIRGENGSQPPRPSLYPPFPLINTTAYPVPPPFFPPGAAFLPPPGNQTDFDEDDPSIYYPPKYDFFYPQDNTTAVPPGPLVPGIILPPPPDFFAPAKPNDEENETDLEDVKKPAFIAPAYLPTDRKPSLRPFTKRPASDKKTTVTYIYPERTPRPKTTKSPGFTSPIYVPSKQTHVPTTTTPRPNHITIPMNKTLKQDIYIISTEPPEVSNNIIDLIRDKKPTKTTTTLDGISPEIHPLRSLIRPDVSVSYIGKVGHLPPSTAFPFAPPTTKPVTGHFITLPPPSVTVTPVPMIKKIRVQPTVTQSPQATFFFYEEPSTTVATVDENEVSPSPYPKDPDYPIKIPRYKPPRTKPVQGELNTLEIENPGLSGLNSVTEPSKHHLHIPTTTESPFIPSNYYATANPASIHFTPIDPNLVDDITMKYFTIFGQKLNAAATTPLTPIPPTSTYRPATTVTSTTTTESPLKYNRQPPSRPQSHFEQYLKEITGHDQHDYIVTHHGNTGPRIKKPKYYLPYRPTEISQYLENVYRSTTLRPVNDVEIQPQYHHHRPASHNFGQYLQEVTTYQRPRNPYFDSSAHSSSNRQRPVSLEGDTLVNYRRPLPGLNPDAELLPPTSYSSTQSNIQIVQPPDLTRNRQQYRPVYQQQQQQQQQRPPQFYFGQNPGNGFVSYNLPGNGGGHFYFLTPQALDRSESENDSDDFGTVKRSDHSIADRLSHQQETSDYLRRRRKKP